MKKIKLLPVFFSLLFLLTACSTEAKKGNNDLQTTYVNSAQEKIQIGDYETAKKILEEGIAKIGDNEVLSQMLLEVETNLQEAVSTTGSDVETSTSERMTRLMKSYPIQ